MDENFSTFSNTYFNSNNTHQSNSNSNSKILSIQQFINVKKNTFILSLLLFVIIIIIY